MATDSPAVDSQGTTEGQVADQQQQGNVIDNDTGQVVEGQGQQADSSTAEQGAKKPTSVLDAVKQALESDGKQAEADKAAAESPTAESQDGAGEQDAAADDEVPTAEEMLEDKSIPQKTKKRIERLLQERQYYQGQAENFQQLQGWIQNSGLSRDDFEQTLAIAALTRNNPIQAVEVLRGVIADIEQGIGLNQHDEDIQRKLDSGLIDEETAQELTKARRAQQLGSARQHQQREQQQHQQQREQVEQSAIAIGTAVQKWELNWKSSDPDYATLRPLVLDKITAMLSQQMPANPDEAVKMAQKAVADIKEQAKRIAGKQQKQIIPTTGGHSTQTNKRPSNSLEAAKLALQTG
jgi:hypothetical protein